MRRSIVVCLLLVCATWPTAAQNGSGDSRQKAFDVLLDTYVRDGLVYYRALKSERGPLDGYVNSLAETPIEDASREAQLAFWLNAYNAIVLKTVVAPHRPDLASIATGPKTWDYDRWYRGEKK